MQNTELVFPISPVTTLRDLVSALPQHFHIVGQYKAVERLILTASQLAEFKLDIEDKAQKKLL